MFSLDYLQDGWMELGALYYMHYLLSFIGF